MADEAGAEDKMQEYRDKVEFEETTAFIKIVWSYMVFNLGAKDKDFKKDNLMLWEKLAELIDSKVFLCMSKYII